MQTKHDEHTQNTKNTHEKYSRPGCEFRHLGSSLGHRRLKWNEKISLDAFGGLPGLVPMDGH